MVIEFGESQRCQPVNKSFATVIHTRNLLLWTLRACTTLEEDCIAIRYLPQKELPVLVLALWKTKPLNRF
jgi:hypothetical protein